MDSSRDHAPTTCAATPKSAATDRGVAEAARIAKWNRASPDYCPDDLTEDEDCPACGATSRPAVKANYCRARHNGPRPRALVSIILTHRDTGEPI